MPSEGLLAAMGKYNDELMNAGVLLDLSGLHPSSKGAHINFSGGKRTAIDGPFAESKELIAGFWVIKAKSKDEAIEWAKRVPAPHGEAEEGEIKIRQLFELEDFGSSKAVDRARGNSTTEEMKREQSASSGWYTKGRLRPCVGRKARKMGHQRPPLWGLGDLPPQGITR